MNVTHFRFLSVQISENHANFFCQLFFFHQLIFYGGFWTFFFTCCSIQAKPFSRCYHLLLRIHFLFKILLHLVMAFRQNIVSGQGMYTVPASATSKLCQSHHGVIRSFPRFAKIHDRKCFSLFFSFCLAGPPPIRLEKMEETTNKLSLALEMEEKALRTQPGRYFIVHSPSLFLFFNLNTLAKNKAQDSSSGALEQSWNLSADGISCGRCELVGLKHETETDSALRVLMAAAVFRVAPGLPQSALPERRHVCERKGLRRVQLCNGFQGQTV